MRIASLVKEMSAKTTTVTDSIHRIYKTSLLAASSYDHNSEEVLNSLNGKIKISVDPIQLAYTPSANIHFPVDFQVICNIFVFISQ
jgi:predicted DNA-binding helix-hairpin-helix protein